MIKDQTYYLSSVPESRLRRVSIHYVYCSRHLCPPNTKALFPIGNLAKPEVRSLARTFGLHTASRDESMGICFVGQKRRFDAFLCERISTVSLIDLPTEPSQQTTFLLGRAISLTQRVVFLVSTPGCGALRSAKVHDCQVKTIRCMLRKKMQYPTR